MTKTEKIRAMTKKAGMRSDSQLLMKSLLYIHQNQNITIPDLEEFTGLSYPSIQRLLRNAREQFLVQVNFYRNTTGQGQGGHYRIDDWGVFNPDRIQDIP